MTQINLQSGSALVLQPEQSQCGEYSAPIASLQSELEQVLELLAQERQRQITFRDTLKKSLIKAILKECSCEEPTTPVHHLEALLAYVEAS